MMKRFLFAISLMMIAFVACDKDDDEKVVIPDLEEYVKNNFPDAQKTASGVYVIVTSEGTGSKPVYGEELFAYYEGTLLTGEVFDHRYRYTDTTVTPVKIAELPMSFNLDSLTSIKGWYYGMAELKKGSKAILLMPNELAYGSANSSQIPAYSPLRFDVELLNLK
jgi:FKBP-type peptidyl-prolyl cis-trans isomerase